MLLCHTVGFKIVLHPIDIHWMDKNILQNMFWNRIVPGLIPARSESWAIAIVHLLNKYTWFSLPFINHPSILSFFLHTVLFQLLSFGKNMKTKLRGNYGDKVSEMLQCQKFIVHVHLMCTLSDAVTCVRLWRHIYTQMRTQTFYFLISYRCLACQCGIMFKNN